MIDAAPRRAARISGELDNELESGRRCVNVRAMQIKDVAAFVKAAEAGNLHVAAEALGITQPALTKSIRRLETSLAVRLFERTARGVALTPIGMVMYERGRALDSMVGDIATEIAEMKSGGGGLIRIGAVPALIETVIAPLLTHFIEAENALRFDIQVRLSGGLLRSLQAAELDLAIATIPAALPADLSVLPLASLRSSVVVRDDHAMLRNSFTLAELAAEKWLLPPPDILLSQWVTAMFIDHGVEPPVPDVRADASPAILAALVRNTNLVTVLTDAMLHSSMGSGLASLGAPARTWDIQLGLFWRRTGFYSAAMTRCRDELVAAFERLRRVATENGIQRFAGRGPESPRGTF